MDQQPTPTTAILINTSLELYQHLSALPLDSKWRMTCRNCNQSSFEVENGIIYLKLIKNSQLYSLFNARRRSSVKALLSALEQQQTPAIIKWKQQRAWEQVGRSRVIALYDMLSELAKMSEEHRARLAMKFSVCNNVITGLDVRFRISSIAFSYNLSCLKDNDIIILLKQVSSRYFLNKNLNRSRYCYEGIHYLQAELEQLYGSRRLLMLNALKEVIDS